MGSHIPSSARLVSDEIKSASMIEIFFMMQRFVCSNLL
jgi:hypothetical protein